MISGLKPYPKCKDSGVPWVGQVPEHWQIAAVRHRYSQCLGKMLDSKRITGNNSLPYLRNTDVQWDRINIERLPRMDIQRSEYDRFTVREGDLLVCEGGEVGRCATWSGDNDVCGFQKALHRLRPLKASHDLPRFMYYALRAATECSAFDDGHVSTIAHLTGDKLRAHRFPFPPFHEQAAVVRFLDCADRRIRQYIRAKQKLIRLLEEQKQAIIHRAVTRGLDPNVRLKPSGVEWLGDVPDHWEIAALRHRYSQCLGKMLDSKRITGSHSMRYLRNTDVQWDKINVEGLPEMDIPPSEYDRYTLQRGDLLICEGGEVGRAAIWSDQLEVCGFQKALHRLRPLNPGRDDPRFAYYAFRTAAAREAFSDGHVSTIAHLTGDKLRALRFPFPPLKEQRVIVGHLDAALDMFCRVEESVKGLIASLRELRTRLISDVVTGKVDVREASVALAEVDDPGFHDDEEDQDPIPDIDDDGRVEADDRDDDHDRDDPEDP